MRLDGHSSITNYIRVINTQLCLFINHRQPASSCVNWWASRFYRGWRANITKKSEIVRVIWRAQISWCLFYWSGVPGFDLLIVRVIWRAWIWSLDRSRYWACLDSISWWLYAASNVSSRLLTRTAYHDMWLWGVEKVGIWAGVMLWIDRITLWSRSSPNTISILLCCLPARHTRSLLGPCVLQLRCYGLIASLRCGQDQGRLLDSSTVVVLYLAGISKLIDISYYRHFSYRLYRNH